MLRHKGGATAHHERNGAGRRTWNAPNQHVTLPRAGAAVGARVECHIGVRFSLSDMGQATWGSDINYDVGMCRMSSPWKMMLVGLTSAGLISVGSCNRSDPDVSRELDLIGSAEDSIDALEVPLIGYQRELLGALATGDSSRVSQMLSTDFVAQDTRRETAEMRSAGATGDETRITYFQVLAGALRDRVEHEFTSYQVSSEGAAATVWAIGARDAVRTSWRRAGSEWLSTRMIILTADDARENLEAARRQR